MNCIKLDKRKKRGERGREGEIGRGERGEGRGRGERERGGGCTEVESWRSEVRMDTMKACSGGTSLSRKRNRFSKAMFNASAGGTSKATTLLIKNKKQY